MLLQYKTGNSPWGLEAFYEGQRLVFSGSFGPNGIGLRKLSQLALFHRPKIQKNPGSIINNVDIFSLFSPNAQRAWSQAFRIAQKRKTQVGAEDLFLALLNSPSVNKLFTRFKVDTKTAETLLNNYLRLKPEPNSLAIKKIPFEAFALSVKMHNHKIGSLMLLGALLEQTPKDNILQAIFENISLNLEKLEIFANWIFNLNYEFSRNSNAAKLFFCCEQAKSLEQHFGYFYEFPAIESAVSLSAGQTFKDLEHLKALQLLIRAGLLAQKKHTKSISKELIEQAAAGQSTLQLPRTE